MIRTVTKTPLIEKNFKKIETLSSADLITCYIFNQQGEHFSFIHKSGEFRYDYQLVGPPSHASQVFRVRNPEPGTVYKLVTETSEPEWSQRPLSGISFAKREEVKSVAVVSRKWEDDFEVILFLNFRRPKNEASLKRAANEATLVIEEMESELRETAKQTCISTQPAWELRNGFSKLLHGAGTSKADGITDWPENLFDEAANDLRKLVKPLKSGKLVHCQISGVNRNGRLTVLGGDKPNEEEQREKKYGVTEFVAHSGSFFQIDSIKKYKRRWDTEAKSGKKILPRYIEFSPRSKARSELACPIMVGSNVLGVINIEADRKKVFNDEHVYLLKHFSAIIAVVLRDHSNWKDLCESSKFVTNIISEGDCTEVYEQAFKVVEKMGYFSRGIWKAPQDGQEGMWVEGSDRVSDSIRSGGLTKWIVKNGLPLLIGDYSAQAMSAGATSMFVGEFDSGALLSHWKKVSKPDWPSPPSAEALNILEEEIKQLEDWDQEAVLCDAGFPIFLNRSSKTVTAVLWVKCLRRRVSILNKQFWHISLICRRITDTKVRIRIEAERDQAVLDKEKEREKERRKLDLERQFGEINAKRMIEIEENGDLDLSQKRVNNVILLRVDLRSSSKFSRACTEKGLDEIAIETLDELNKETYRAITENSGLFERSTGDGAVGAFNLYRPDIIDLNQEAKQQANDANSDQKEEKRLINSQKSALEAMFQIFDTFAAMREDLDSRVTFALPTDFTVAGSLVMDSDKTSRTLVGEHDRTSRYVVAGHISHLAAKLIDHARANEIAGILTHSDDHSGVRKLTSAKEFHPMEFEEQEALENWLSLSSRPILLCSLEFAKVVDESVEYDGHVITKPDWDHSINRVLLVRRKNDLPKFERSSPKNRDQKTIPDLKDFRRF